MTKIIRISTVPMSLNILLRGQLSFLSNYFTIIGISSEGPDLYEVERREGIKTISINMQRQISLLKDFISLFQLYNEFRKEKPDVVHSITPKAGLLSMIAAKLAGVPVRIHTFTGLIFPSKKGIIQNILIIMDRILCLCATNIYPEGIGVKNDLIKFKITSKPLKILANGNVNGIDMNYFDLTVITQKEILSLKNDLGILDTDFVFIFVGRLVVDKGITELIAAFKKVTNSRKHGVKLLLVGPLEQDLDPLSDQTLQEIKSNANILSVGFQKDVRPYFSVADILVFPSYREGFPNVVMQAGAMGLPSIVSDINGCNEIIVEGLNGTIIPVKDISAIYDAMMNLMDNKALMLQFKENARKIIQEKYEQSVVWKALLAEYNNLLKERKL